MATKINFSTILKRSQTLNSFSTITESSKIDSEKLYENVITVLRRCKTGKEAGVQQALRTYIESMCNFDNASEFYWQPFELVSEFNKLDKNISDKIIYEYCNRIIPYVKDLVSIDECIYNYELTGDQVSSVLEAVSVYNVADRIINNHNNISSRFNIDKIITKYKVTSPKYFIDSCADMIATYNVPNYQKMNITLEEGCYLLDKNGIDYNKSDIARYVLEYYLTQSPSISPKDRENYRKVLESSYILDENDLSGVDFYIKDRYIYSSSINSAINKFLIENKTENSISDNIKAALRNTSTIDIINNTDKIFSTLWDIRKNELFDTDDCVYETAKLVIDYISENARLESDEKKFSKDDVEDILTSVESINIMVKSCGNVDPDLTNIANDFIKRALDPSINSLKELTELLYCNENIYTINYLDSNTEVVPVNEYKIFKFHNLVRAAFNLDKFLKVKEKKVYTAGKLRLSKFAKKAKHVLFGEAAVVENNMIDYIGEDMKADICVAQYTYSDNELKEVTGFLENVCREYNDLLLSQNESCRAYFMINPNLAEIRIKESASVELENPDEIYNHIDESFDLYFESIIRSNNLCDINESSIISESINIDKCDNFTLEKFELALDAMSIIGVKKDIIIEFAVMFDSYHFNNAINNGIINESYIKLASQERIVDNLVNEYTIEENADWEDKIMAKYYLTQLLESSDDDDDEDEYLKSLDVDDDKKDDTKSKSSNTKNKKPSEIVGKDTGIDIKKDPKDAPKEGYSGGIKLHNIKLGIMGLKTKFKEFDTKQKELSKNLDNATRALVKGMKDSLVSDRREAVIKGSIIPSFSRCIKAAIGLAVVAQFSLPAAVIGAFGAFALSKKLTNRERILLLDEIETELDVIEKELSIADSNNEINKYRALLKYKKELQRQYQRIRYNIRVGKDILPSSSAGFVSRD